MDPDQALTDARDALRGTESENDARAALAALALADAFRALDEWLTKGGFLPADWAR